MTEYDNNINGIHRSIQTLQNSLKCKTQTSITDLIILNLCCTRKQFLCKTCMISTTINHPSYLSFIICGKNANILQLLP